MKCPQCDSDDLRIVTYDVGPAIVCQGCEHHWYDAVRRTPVDMAKSMPRQFRVGHLVSLASAIDRELIRTLIRALSRSESASRNVSLLSGQVAVQRRKEGSQITDDTPVFIHDLTYNELREIYLLLKSATDSAASLMDWVAVGRHPYDTEETDVPPVDPT